MINSETKKFILDILEEIRRMDVINRNCANLLSILKTDIDYEHYVMMLDALTLIDDAVREAFLKVLDVKSDLCDIQQR